MDGQKKDNKKIISPKNKNTIIAAIIITIVVIIGIIGYIFSVNNRLAAWENKV